MSDNQVELTRQKPLLDRTITYGHILTAISFITAGTAAFFGMKAELQNVDQRVAKIEATLQQLANVVVQTARQDERLNAIERRVDRFEQTPASKPP
jgi:type VI protein secretion system component VasK